MGSSGPIIWAQLSISSSLAKVNQSTSDVTRGGISFSIVSVSVSMEAISITTAHTPLKHSFRAISSPSSSFIPSLFTFPLSRNPNFSFLSLSSSVSLRTTSNLRFNSSAATVLLGFMLSFHWNRRIAMLIGGSPNVELEAESSRIVGENDLLIVGPGVLGRLVAQKWKEDHPECSIHGQTATTFHHDDMIQMGITPSLKGTKLPFKFPYVIFCAPPSRSPDYPGELSGAVSNWNGEGCFVFTSSSAPYDCDDNGYCDESTPSIPIGKNPRADVLLKAENVVLDSDRGAHNFWLQKGTVDARPDHIMNLIHYEDAASLAVAILKKDLRGRTFLGCDNHPLSRQEVMDLANESGKFGKKFKAFTGTDGPLGKRLNNSKTRTEIGWEPKYSSFANFLETM
ncbi:hypothetical protein V2J09_014276 [Rumex salicifolius]